MANVLLISRNDIVKYTALNGNLDVDKFIQFIYIAQQIHVLNYLGTDLLEKVKSDIAAGSLTGNYQTLVETYVKPMLVHFSMVEYLPFSGVTISNNGIYKHNSENSSIIDQDELEKLIAAERKIAEHYASRCVDYLCNNSSLFPEYTSNTGSDFSPSSDVNNTNWYI